MEEDPYARRFPFEREISTEIDQRLADEYHAIRLRLATKHLLPAARDGDRRSALALVEQCSDAILDNARVSNELAKWLADGLLHIARGDTVEEAFWLPPRGRGKGKEGASSVALARQIRWAYRVAYITKVENRKQLYAFAKIAEDDGIDHETVRQAWKKYGKGAVSEIEFQRKVLGKVTPI